VIRKAFVVILGAALLSACASTDTTSSTTRTTSKVSIAAASPGTVNCTYVTGSSPAKPVDPPSGANVASTGTVAVVITTNEGPITITFRDETYATDTFPAGTVAMANAGTNTNGSQFFLVYADSPLPPKYTVFGHMDAAGIAVVAKVAAGGDDGSISAGGGKPNIPVNILTVTVG